MSISRQNLTIVIVTLKSENIIDQCLESIDKNIPVIVVENSNNQKFKNRLESKYQNLKCILAESNLGMGAGNNIGIKEAKTEFILILNPDVLLEKNTLEELYGESYSEMMKNYRDVNWPGNKVKLKEKINNLRKEYPQKLSEVQ